MSESIESSFTSPLLLPAPIPLLEHPAEVYLASLSPGSRKSMRYALDAVARLLTDNTCDAMTLNWAAVRYKHTAAIRAAFSQKYAPAYVNKLLSAVRRVLKEALRLELIDAVDFSRAVDIKNLKDSQQLRGRIISQEEINALMQVCFDDPTPGGYRDAALIGILRGCGVRRSELVNLNVTDLDLKTGAVFVRHGKGGKDRTVYLPESGLSVVGDWLSLRGREDSPLLCQVNKSGRIVRQRLTSQAVLFILLKRGQQIGVENFSAHDFRRTFISELLDSGEDISTVQRLAGHANTNQTARYDRRGEETKRRAVQKLTIPVRSKKSVNSM
ncbi:tyrosine-type recombinase/integrase [Nostoc sp. FACHB-87]|uniref:tyrosine-type recombinase/integrase n=1 Tax=Nostocaceae TaxID=1162 RepID=UPI001682E3E3|nr:MULTISPECIES: site-specific integrase [Nostocaceae]MBD2457334.1 tyrosine-type recombinase/integrase [Nostoc sp. FACHB-87]MBD2478403.1 tyrosine-type recombinase/integrase [Anabaena sp. FACHB-83]